MDEEAVAAEGDLITDEEETQFEVLEPDAGGGEETVTRTSACAVVSVTKDMRSFLSKKALQEDWNVNPQEERPESLDVISVSEGYALEDYVACFPDKALKIAQACAAYWENVMTCAALSGGINDEEGNFRRVGREQAVLLERRVAMAREDLTKVQALIDCGVGYGDTRRGRLIYALYNKAAKGDLRAIQYFLDKTDVRPDENGGLNEGNQYAVFSIVHTLFDKQLDILNSGPGTRMACCSRRAGKSRLAAAMILIEALRTDYTTCVYVSPTIKNAERAILGPALEEIISICDLRDSKGNRMNWRRLENGSKIELCGLMNIKDPDKIRGYKAKVIVIDEFFHLNSDLLEYLQHEVLEPMQMDYADDYKQLMIGTPPRNKGTYGEKQWNELKVPKYIWTAHDNPHMPDVEKYIQAKAAEKGLDITHPWVQREYYAQWVYDTDAMLFSEYHTYDRDTMPSFNVDRILCGLDYGVSDNNAIVAIAWDSEARRGYVFYEVKFNRLTCDKNVSMITQLKEEVETLWNYCLDFWPNIDKKEANKRIYWEADSSDQQLSQELLFNVHSRYEGLRLNIGNAHKLDKVLMYDKMADMFRRADLLLPADGATALECDRTVLKRDGKGNILPDIDDKVYHPDLLPAIRYALWPAIGREVTQGTYNYTSVLGGTQEEGLPMPKPHPMTQGEDPAQGVLYEV